MFLILIIFFQVVTKCPWTSEFEENISLYWYPSRASFTSLSQVISLHWTKWDWDSSGAEQRQHSRLLLYFLKLVFTSINRFLNLNKTFLPSMFRDSFLRYGWIYLESIFSQGGHGGNCSQWHIAKPMNWLMPYPKTESMAKNKRNHFYSLSLIISAFF